jgi:hypothetical protein
MTTDDERKKRLIKYYREFRKAISAWENGGCKGTVQSPIFPEDLRGLHCGAKNRKGFPCRNTNLRRNGRCKFHGGRSTGPKTAAGKQRSAQNLPKTLRVSEERSLMSVPNPIKKSPVSNHSFSAPKAHGEKSRQNIPIPTRRKK